MIIFNECRIIEDGKCLIVEASINNMHYFDDCYIEEVWIDTDKTYSAKGTPSENAKKIEFEHDNVSVVSIEDNVKTVYLNLRPKNLDLADFNNNILFIYIKTKGYPKPDCPCGMDNEWHLCAAWNYKPIYDTLMSYIKELADTCSIPKNFIDILLKLKAIQLALKSGHFTQAIELWQRWEIGSTFKLVSSKRKCGCHGYN